LTGALRLMFDRFKMKPATALVSCACVYRRSDRSATGARPSSWLR